MDNVWLHLDFSGGFKKIYYICRNQVSRVWQTHNFDKFPHLKQNKNYINFLDSCAFQMVWNKKIVHHFLFPSLISFFVFPNLNKKNYLSEDNAGLQKVFFLLNKSECVFTEKKLHEKNNTAMPRVPFFNHLHLQHQLKRRISQNRYGLKWVPIVTFLKNKMFFFLQTVNSINFFFPSMWSQWNCWCICLMYYQK